MLNIGDKIGLVACSNAQMPANRDKIEQLEQNLYELGLEVIESPYLFAKEGVFSGTGQERAAALMAFYKNPEIKAVFDISGGDIANEVLSEMDFEVIRKNPKPFWGYSDLTTIVNAIWSQTGQESYLYQIRNLIYDHKIEQAERFKASVFEEKNDLFDANWQFIQGEKIEGVVIGGNIRCFLKLEGTPFMPDFKDHILFLEAMGGEVAQMTTYLNQLKQMNAFKKVKGILLGTFTAMERENCRPSITELVVNVVNDQSLPIVKTKEIGHGSDAKALVIGRSINLKA